MRLKTKRKALIIHKLYLSEQDRLDLFRLLKKSNCAEVSPQLSKMRFALMELLEDKPQSHGMGSKPHSTMRAYAAGEIEIEEKDLAEMLKPQCD